MGNNPDGCSCTSVMPCDSREVSYYI